MRARGIDREGSASTAPRDAGPISNPEIGPVFELLPLLMKMPSGPLPPPPPVLSPPAPTLEAVPPGVPGLVPSGEMETRAERFPAGIAGGGATGAGVAESAMSVSLSPVRPPMYGAAALASAFRGVARGADIGFTGSSGFGAACEDEAMSIAPGCFSSGEISGSATFEALTGAGVFGRKEVSSLAVSCNFGRSGWRLASCTMFGRAGKILGGSCGALVWTSVCRGCVGCNGSERMVCRGWNASVPRVGSGFDASFRAAALGGRGAGRRAGKSFAGPYQAISVRGAAETMREDGIFQMGGG